MLSDYHRNNLEKLGRYLARLSPGHNKAHFRMETYFRHNYDEPAIIDALSIVRTHLCGTVACAVGHTPLAMPKEFAEYTDKAPNKYSVQSWNDLSADMFGADPEGRYDNDHLWDFLFGGSWATAETKYKRTSWAVADRIAYYITNSTYIDRQEFNRLTIEDDSWIGEAFDLGWISRQKHTSNLRQAERIFV